MYIPMDNIFIDELEDNSLVFEDDNGKEVTMPIISIFSIKENIYVVLLAESGDEDTDPELMVVRALQEDGKEYIELITDPEEWETVKEYWNAMCDKIIAEENNK